MSLFVLFYFVLLTSYSFASDSRSKNTFMLGYEPITTWLPSKKTLSYTHNLNPKWSIEGEYAWASIDFPIANVDLGQIKEKRYALQARRYVTKSFHFIFGATYYDFKARLGNDFLNNSFDEIEGGFRVRNIGLTTGLGNRWHLANGFTFGVDWLRLNVPLAQTDVDDQILGKNLDESDQNRIKKVIKAVNRIPTFVLFGVSLGYTF